MKNPMHLIGGLFGAAFGFVLAASQLHEYDTIHAMLALEEIDVYLLMASAIAVSAPLLWLLERRGYSTAFGGVLSLRRSRPQKHHLQGLVDRRLQEVEYLRSLATCNEDPVATALVGILFIAAALEGYLVGIGSLRGGPLRGAARILLAAAGLVLALPGGGKLGLDHWQLTLAGLGLATMAVLAARGRGRAGGRP